jgi:hypothetical protein
MALTVISVALLGADIDAARCLHSLASEFLWSLEHVKSLFSQAKHELDQGSRGPLGGWMALEVLA